MVILASSNMRLAIVVEVMAIFHGMRERQTLRGRAEMNARLHVPVRTEAGMSCVDSLETKVAVASSTEHKQTVTANNEAALAKVETEVTAEQMPTQMASSESPPQPEWSD